MIPAGFEYHRASSAREAVELLEAHPGARLLAGGHSLLPMMKLRLAAPPALIDVGGIDELRFIRHDDGSLVVGALTTHAEIAASDEVRASHRALAEAAAAIGDVQVRNYGTVGGSLAHADPAADYPAVVLALGAEVDVLGPDGERTVAGDELFTGLMQTSLKASEIVTAVRCAPAAGGGSAYLKFAQPASGFALVGVAAAVRRGADGNCDRARVAATGVSDRPVRLTGVEEALAGGDLSEEHVAGACADADASLEDVRSDQHGDEAYRRQLVRVISRRAVLRAAS